MEFIVIGRAIDSANVPPEVAIALGKQTFEMLKAKQGPRVKALYPFAGEKAGALIIEAKSGDELQEVLSSFPLSAVSNFPLSAVSNFEVHPLATLDGVLKTMEAQEKLASSMAPAGVR
jgi:muconolactone delta-isomerase